MTGLVLLGAEVRPTVGANYTDAKTVAAVQAALVKLGYDLGKTGPNKDGVDGDFGPKTKKAIKKLQKTLNTEAHGRIDEGVIMALKVTPGVLPPGVTMEGRAAVQAEAAVKAAKIAEAAADKGDKPAAVQAAQAVVEAAPAQPPELKEKAKAIVAKVQAASTPEEVKKAAEDVKKVAEDVKSATLPWWQERAWAGGPQRWQAGLAGGGGVVGLGLLFALLARR